MANWNLNEKNKLGTHPLSLCPLPSPFLYPLHPSIPACAVLEWNTGRATSPFCLLWHNSVWLLPDFPSCPLAWWGNCQWWLEAILPRQSGEGQGCPSATLSSWALWPCLTCLVEDRDWHMSGKFTCRTWPLWLWNDFRKTVFWHVYLQPEMSCLSLTRLMEWWCVIRWTGTTVLLEVYGVQEDSMMQVWLEEGCSLETMAHC